MPRPIKFRRVASRPISTRFKPSGNAGIAQGDEIILALDEYEALRLCDLLGREQKPSAACMKISRQTFGNILRSARRKLADCVIKGKSLRIEGGAITMRGIKLRCCDCGTGWTGEQNGKHSSCPRCNGKNIQQCQRRQCCKFKQGAMPCMKIKGETK
jgi:predicted DNA-binding protein (UPF0251 family)